ncbi:ABC transporter ATP-binding protein [Klugiella xanthotipulae]|uniref:ATP-binding cassette subfamily B protein n=1 Tax=Klugiella xanthotipulae TaxID=244735 RepID=A0A543HYT9_9MICO|nr:ABC transporter ATP-binding protein [Klugiella xanthotipulae]TQM63478.1 ATP-binding cassette subfamily B protein [Klugiella xanthotipulae]
MSDTPTRRPARRGGRPGRGGTGPRATFGQLLPYIFEQRGTLAFVIVLSVLGAAATLAQPLLVSQVITIVGESKPLGLLVWLLVGLVVVSGVISGYQHYLLQRMGEGVVLSSRRRLIARILNLPISEFDRRRTGDLVSRVGSDTTLLRAVLTQGLVEAIGGSLTFMGALIAMFLLDPVLLGLTVLVIAVSVVAVVSLAGRIRAASAEAQKRVGDLAASVERAISSIRTVRASNATEREAAAVAENAQGAWRMGITVAKVSALVVPVAGVAMQVSFLVVLGIGGARVASGDITIANLVAFIIFLFMMIMPLGQAFGAISAVNQALGALGRIQEIIALPTENQFDRSVLPATTLAASAVPGAASVEFAEVHFTYRSTVTVEGVDGEGSTESIVETPVLHGVSFTAEHGTRIALVGPSGAGKSTTLNLIERFYDPDSGVIRMDGVDIRALERTELRAQLGYVEQDAPVLAGTLRDNLRLNAPDATDAECSAVLHAVNLSEVLERDPAGLDAEVGENGIMLSGGEKQRLAIARALVAAPPILLLDESTSSLDGANERMMREAIDAVATDRTLIVIAHRLSTVVDSDKIVVFEHGRIVGEGTHAELIESTPLYRNLAEHQLLT